MSREEARRPGPVRAAVAGKITTAEGAHALEISLRQFRRLSRPVRLEFVGERMRSKPPAYGGASAESALLDLAARGYGVGQGMQDSDHATDRGQCRRFPRGTEP
jgi:hypothetical protein